MKTTIDKAGRVVIPAILREKTGLKPGTMLEVVADDIAIHLFPTAPSPKLVRRGKRLVAKATAKPKELPEIDLASLIEEERNRRHFASLIQHGIQVVTANEFVHQRLAH